MRCLDVRMLLNKCVHCWISVLSLGNDMFKNCLLRKNLKNKDYFIFMYSILKKCIFEKKKLKLIVLHQKWNFGFDNNKQVLREKLFQNLIRP